MEGQVDGPGFSWLVSEAEPRLRDVLVALYGPERGREATVEALNWAWETEYSPDRPASLETLRHLYRLAQRRSSLLRARPGFDIPPGHVDWLEPELGAMLSFLPRSDRMAAMLVGGAGWSAEEVAAVLSISPSRAAKHTERGLGMLSRSVRARFSTDEMDEAGDDDEDALERAKAEADALVASRLHTLFEAVPAVSPDEAIRPDLYPSARLLDLSPRSGDSSPWLRVTALVGAVLVLSVAGLLVGLYATRSTTETSYTTPGSEPSSGPLTSSVVAVPTPVTAGGLESSTPSPLLSEIDPETRRPLRSPKADHLAARTVPVVTGSYVVDVLFAGADAPSGEAVAFRAGRTKTVDLGRASSAYAGLEPGTVWLVLHDATMSGSSSRACSIRLVTTKGQVLLKATTIPCPWQVVTPMPGGLVVLARTGVLELWHPSSGLTEPLPQIPAPLVESAGSTLLAIQWHTFCSVHCWVSLIDPATGALTTVHLYPPTGMSLTTSAAISPNGRFLAVTAIPIGEATVLVDSPFLGPHCCDSSARPLNGRIVVIRLSNGTVAMSRPASFLQPSVVKWSPDGSYVFLSASSGDIDVVPVWSDAVPAVSLKFRDRTGVVTNPGENFLVIGR